MKSLIFVVVLWGSSLTSTTYAIRPRGASPVDLSRAIYEKQQDDMWSIVKNTNLQKHDIQEKMYTRYKSLIDSNWTDRYDEYKFINLKRYYEWNLVEKEVLSIQSLWDEFKKFIQNQFVTENFSELAGTEFADTVFHDKHLAINNSLETIYLSMVTQGFYYKASGVRRGCFNILS